SLASGVALITGLALPTRSPSSGSSIAFRSSSITGYLMLRPFDDAEAAQLEQFLCEETCRLEQAAALMGRAREFLKSSACSSALAFRIARIVGEQRARAREHIFRRPTQSGRFPPIA